MDPETVPAENVADIEQLSEQTRSHRAALRAALAGTDLDPDSTQDDIDPPSSGNNTHAHDDDLRRNVPPHHS